MSSETAIKADAFDAVTKFTNAVAQLLVIFALIPLRGFVVATMWRWFVVPFGVAEIGVWWACGILALTHPFQHVRRSKGDTTWSDIFYGGFASLWFLGFAWIFRSLAF